MAKAKPAGKSALDAVERLEQTESTKPDVKTVKRVGIVLTDDERSIAWDQMRPSTIEKLKRLLNDPSSPIRVSETATKGDDKIDPMLVNILYGSIGTVLIAAAARMGYPKDEALKMQFTPEERSFLVEPTQKVLAKYTPALGKWEPEITLALAIGSIVTTKFTTIRKPATVIDIATREERVSSTPDAMPTIEHPEHIE